MAGEHDGSIIIDTELDREGFEKGSEKLIAAIQDMTNALDNLGDNVMQSFSKVIPLLESIAGTATQTSGAMEDSATRAADVANRAAEGERNLADSSQRAAVAAQQQSQSMKDMASAANAAQTGINKTVSGTAQYDAALAKIQKQIDKTKAKLADYYKELAEIQASTDESLTHSANEQSTTVLLEIEEQQIARLNEKYSDQISTLQELEKEYSRLSELRTQMGAENTVIGDTESIKALDTELNSIIQKIGQYEEKVAKLNTLGAKDSQWESIRYDIEQAGNELTAFQARLSALHDSGMIPTDEFERLSLAISEAASRQESLTDAIKPNIWGKFAEKISSAADAALRLAKNLAKAAFHSVASGVKALAGKLGEFAAKSSATKNLVDQLTHSLTSLKTILMSRIKRMFISNIFNGAKESLQELAVFSSGFNTAMSNITNSAKMLSANLSVSLGGLISVIEPVLTRIINLISTAITYLNAFFAMLSGKKTVTVAKKQTASYAGTVASAGKETKELADDEKEATQEAKKLKRQLAGFDEINRLEFNDDAADSIGDLTDSLDDLGDLGGGGISDLFEEVPIDDLLPEAIKDFFERLKAAIEAGDWYGVGQILAEGLNSVMKVVDDWINNVFRPKGVEWAGNIANMLNGLTDGANWELAGKTIADGLNAIVDIYNTFMDKYDFKNLGAGLARSLNEFIDKAEWENIGKAFAQKWQALIDTIFSLVHNTHWDDLGKGIGEAINGWFKKINFRDAADALATGLNGIFTSIQNTIDTVDWDKISSQLSDAFTTLVTNVDWAKNAATLSDLVVHLLNTFNDAVTQKDWQEFGRSIGEALDAIDWWGIIKGVGEALWNAFSGVISGLFDSNTGKVIIGIKGGLLAIKGLFKVGKAVGGVDLAGSIAEWAKNASSNFDLIKTAAGKIAPHLSQVLKPIASVIFSPKGLIIAAIVAAVALIVANWDTIKEKAGELKDKLAEKWEEIKTNISEKWDQIKTDASEKWESIKSTLTEKWENVKTKAGEKWEEIKTTVVDTWENLKKDAGTKWEEIKTVLSEKWDTIKTTAQTTWDTIKTAVSGAWDGLKSGAATAWEGIKSTVTSIFGGTKDDVSATATGVQTDVSGAWDAVLSSTNVSWDSIALSLTQTWDRIGESSMQTWNGIQQNVVSVLTQMREQLHTQVEGIRTQFTTSWTNLRTMNQTTWTNIKTVITTTADNLRAKLMSTTTQIQTNIKTAWQSVKSTSESQWSAISTAILAKWTSLKSTMLAVDWTSVGSQMAAGVKSGFASQWPSVVSYVQSCVSSLVASVRSQLQIASPSKVFAKIGAFTVEGLIVGMQSSEKDALKTASALARDMTDRMQTDTTLDMSIKPVITEIDTLTDKLSGVASIFQRIADTLQAVGGFTAPEIAVGEVVPVKTRIAPTSPLDVEQGRFDALMEDVVKSNVAGYESMLAILREILEAILGIEIGDEVIGRAAARYSRRMNLITGG